MKKKKKTKSFGGLAWIRKLFFMAIVLFAAWVAYDYTMHSKKINGGDMTYAGSFLERLERAIHSGAWKKDAPPVPVPTPAP